MTLLPYQFRTCGMNIAALITVCSAVLSSPSMADTPLGWLTSDHLSAYTQNARTFDLNLSAIAVNEDIDFLNIRDDLLAGTRRLEGDSGDLSGNKIELNVGITSTLSAFYRRQEQDLTIDLGEISSLELVSLDDGLTTTSTSYGFKWNFFESGYFDNSRPWHAASLEVTRVENNTDDFDGVVKRIRIGTDIVLTFVQPQGFRVEKLNDEGWQARLLYSFPMSDSITASVWAGYNESEATSGTNSDIPVATLKQAFEQSFETEESQILFGASLNWQITPRLPIQMSYEYLRTNKSEFVINSNPLNSLLPSFLRGDSLSSAKGSDNHTLRGSISYWVTPIINVSLTAKVFSNQFLGVIPHFNNPLTGSFSDQPYGYAGIRVGIAL